MKIHPPSIPVSFYHCGDLTRQAFPCLKDREIHIWQFSLMDAEKLPSPETCLSEEELAQLSRYKPENARLCYQTGHTALRLILSGYLRIPAAALDIRASQYGKLFLRLENAIHFNISHSGTYVVLAFCRFSPVGIDLEEIYDNALAENIIRRFFHPKEKEEYPNLPQEQRRDWFFRRWTIREAYVKALGTGLHTAPESFCVREEADGSFTVRPDEKAASVGSCQILPVRAPNGYVCTLAWFSEPIESALP